MDQQIGHHFNSNLEHQQPILQQNEQLNKNYQQHVDNLHFEG
jgi:hypothetical protein